MMYQTWLFVRTSKNYVCGKFTGKNHFSISPWVQQWNWILHNYMHVQHADIFNIKQNEAIPCNAYTWHQQMQFYLWARLGEYKCSTKSRISVCPKYNAKYIVPSMDIQALLFCKIMFFKYMYVACKHNSTHCSVRYKVNFCGKSTLQTQNY